MGCFPSSKHLTKDSKSVLNQNGYPSTEMGNSIKLSIYQKSPEKKSKHQSSSLIQILRRSTKVESKYSIIKREGLEFIEQYKVINNEINKPFLMTLINKSSILNEVDFLRTLCLLTKFKSDRLINMIDYFEDNVNYYLISEYFEDKNLFDKVSSLSYYSEDIIAEITFLLLETMDELSSSKIKLSIINPKVIYLNQDIKSKDIQIKINALSYIEEYISNSVEDNYTFLFTSPGLLSAQSMKGSNNIITCTHSLVWSIGVILYCLFLGTIPFSGINKEAVLRSIKSKAYIKSIEEGSISPNGKALLKEMLMIDYKKRIEAKTIVFHPFFGELNGKEKCTQIMIDEETLIKINGMYSTMHFIEVTNGFINNYLIMQNKLKELIPNIKHSMDNKECNDIIEDIISTYIGSSMSKMKLSRVKEETCDLNLNHLDIIKGIVYNWYQLNQKKFRKAFNLLVSYIKDTGAVSKSDVINVLSYTESQIVMDIICRLKEISKETVLFDEFESIVIQALIKGNQNDVIREIVFNKENGELFKEKWPFADSSFDIQNLIPGNHCNLDSSVSSSDDF